MTYRRRIAVWNMRRSIVLTTALAVALGAAAPVAAQVDPSGDAPAASATKTTKLTWKRVKLPKAGDFLWPEDIIPVGSGFLAVGGGIRKSPRALARVWKSTNGRRWESVPLKGLARNGMPHAITQTPSGGFVMVGRGSCAFPCAAAWRSPDGVVWERLPETFAQSMMYDVTAFDGRLIAVGCHTPGFHCLWGQVWASDDDGASWQLLADEVSRIMFHAVTAAHGQLVATGDTDGFDTARRTTATSPDGVTWTFQEPGSELGWMRAAGVRGGRALVGGGDHDRSDKTMATLMVLNNDGRFEGVKSDRFRKAFISDLAAQGDTVVLSGLVVAKRVTMPWSVLSSDMNTFKRVRFPKADERRYGEAMAVAFSRNGARAVVGGRSGNRGAMWFTRVK